MHNSRAVALALTVAGCMPTSEQPAVDRGDEAAIVDPHRSSRWPNRVPFVLDLDGKFPKHDCESKYHSSKPFKDPNTLKQTMQKVVDFYNTYTPIELVEYDPKDAPSGSLIIYTLADKQDQKDLQANTDHIGMPAGGKRVCIDIYDGVDVRTLKHETFHALGAHHEQQRFDRKDYLKYDPTCVPKNDDNFETLSYDEALPLAPFDADSIMEYHSVNHCDCDKKGCCDKAGTCLKPPLLLLPDLTIIEKYKDFSFDDINSLYRMYEKPLADDSDNSHFGAALAAADFDGDGQTDVAVGAPDKNGYGELFLFRGTRGTHALVPEDKQVAARLVAWTGRTPLKNPGQAYGAAMAVGDFDGDGIADLAVGGPAPNQACGTVEIYQSAAKTAAGKPVGLARSQTLIDGATLNGKPACFPTEQFGAALAAADFDRDGFDDLAVGIPGWSRNYDGVEQGGVFIYHGGKHGLTPWLAISQSDVTGSDETGSRFGASLFAVDLRELDGVRHIELIVGAPETDTALPGTGAAYRFQPAHDASGAFYLAGKYELRPESLQPGARFGTAIVAGDFTGGGIFDFSSYEVAVGAPGQDEGAGAIFLFSVGKELMQTLTMPDLVASRNLGGVLAAGGPVGRLAMLYAGMPDSVVNDLPAAGVVFRYQRSAETAAALDPIPIVLHGSIPTANHRFGASLAFGHFYDDVVDELVVGSTGNVNGAGAFHVNHGGVNDWLNFRQSTANPE